MIKIWYIYDVLGQKELRMRSQAVQREMPRPTDVNSNILRVVGPSDPALNELQKVCLPFLLIPFSDFFQLFSEIFI